MTWLRVIRFCSPPTEDALIAPHARYRTSFLGRLHDATGSCSCDFQTASDLPAIAARAFKLNVRPLTRGRFHADLYALSQRRVFVGRRITHLLKFAWAEACV